jgi:hypothetical protein
MNRWRFPHRCKKVHLFPSISSLLPIGPKISTCSGRCSQGARIIPNQKSNDSLLGLALGRRDRLRVSVQRQPRYISAQRNAASEARSVGKLCHESPPSFLIRNDYSSYIASTPYGGWPQMGRWLVPFICRAKAYRQSRCCIRPGHRCLPRSSRHAIRAEGSVPCLK